MKQRAFVQTIRRVGTTVKCLVIVQISVTVPQPREPLIMLLRCMGTRRFADAVEKQKMPMRLQRRSFGQLFYDPGN